jgi:SAM-dependent methyltransferase
MNPDEARHPTKNRLEPLPERCAVCGNDRAAVLLRHHPWRVLACTGCGLGVLYPRPSGTDLQTLYEADYFLTQYDGGLDPFSAAFQKRIRSEAHRVRFVKKAAFSGTLLDMGCGYGYFLAAARNAGFDAMGHEIAAWAGRYAQERLNLPVVGGPLSVDLFSPHRFDIISMWHFLEHTPDVNATLAAAATWLKPDGALVIDVPNYDGTDARKSGARWVGWQLPYHLYHFSPGSLKRLLEKHGFSIRASKNYHSEIVKERLRRIPLVGWAARPIAKFYSGTSYAVIARRRRFPA